MAGAPFPRLLPRLLEIIYEINARFLAEVARRWPGDSDRQRRMSLIEEGRGAAGAHGVSGHRRQLLGQRRGRPAFPAARQGLFHDFYRAVAGEVQQQDQRRHPAPLAGLLQSGLSRLITETIGEGWVTDLRSWRSLAPHMPRMRIFAGAGGRSSRTTRSAWRRWSQSECGVEFDPEALFDVQVKRIHEYKRQLLNVLHVIHLYDRIKRGDTAGWTAAAC